MAQLHDLDWLIGRSVSAFTRREYDWVLSFENETQLVIGCLWRLVEAGRIRRTSQDHQQSFGLGYPIDAAAEVAGVLRGALVMGIDLKEGPLDLKLDFASGHTLQVVPDSTGYEAWTLSTKDRQLIAAGGGELHRFDWEPR